MGRNVWNSSASVNRLSNRRQHCPSQSVHKATLYQATRIHKTNIYHRYTTNAHNDAYRPPTDPPAPRPWMGCNNSQLKFKAQALGRYMPPAVAITILLLCMLSAVSLPTPQTVEVVSEPAGLHHHLQGPGVDYYDYSSRMILETVDNPQLGPNFHASSNPQARTVLKKTVSSVDHA